MEETLFGAQGKFGELIRSRKRFIECYILELNGIDLIRGHHIHLTRVAVLGASDWLKTSKELQT